MSKDITLRFRIEAELAKVFEQVCAAENENPSTIMRGLLEEYISNHDIARNSLDVNFSIVDKDIDVSIGSLYGKGVTEKDEYRISATITGSIASLATKEILFLLPEFKIDGYEPYRVDSFYYHREFFPSCRNNAGRLLGAKLIKNRWEGAIFLYKNDFIHNPQPAFDDIKKKLRDNILHGINLFFMPKEVTQNALNNK